MFDANNFKFLLFLSYRHSIKYTRYKLINISKYFFLYCSTVFLLCSFKQANLKFDLSNLKKLQYFQRSRIANKVGDHLR